MVRFLCAKAPPAPNSLSAFQQPNSRCVRASSQDRGGVCWCDVELINCEIGLVSLWQEQRKGSAHTDFVGNRRKSTAEDAGASLDVARENTTLLSPCVSLCVFLSDYCFLQWRSGVACAQIVAGRTPRPVVALNPLRNCSLGTPFRYSEQVSGHLYILVVRNVDLCRVSFNFLPQSRSRTRGEGANGRKKATAAVGEGCEQEVTRFTHPDGKSGLIL